MKGVCEEYKKGLWTVEEDRILAEYVGVHGKGKWNQIPQDTGLKRCGKSCRLRWVNYLSPNVKRGDFSREEDDLTIRLHNLPGNRWSLIAGRVPGRTNNQVKNHWNTHLRKKRGFNGPRCRDNALSVTTTTTTTTSRHLPKVKRRKARLTVSSDPDKNAVEDDVSSRQARPTSQRGAVVADDRPSTSVWFFDDELNLICAPNIMGEFAFDFILQGRAGENESWKYTCRSLHRPISGSSKNGMCNMSR